MKLAKFNLSDNYLLMMRFKQNEVNFEVTYEGN